MKLVSPAGARRSPAPRSALHRLAKPLLGLITVATLALVLTRQGLVAPATAKPQEAAATNPLGQLSRSALDLTPIEGHVEELLPAGPYTYLAVRTAGELVWAVTLGGAPPPGTAVHVQSMGRRTSFHSRRLGRTFPELVFGLVSRID
jgi:hypothetical protein